MTAYPAGTVAFLFTDIEGSTRRWEARQQAMWAAVERHFDILRDAISTHEGVLFKTVGDAVQAAFPTVPNAVAAAIAAQHVLHETDWGELGPLRVRMAIHVGEAAPRDGDYLAPALNRLARVLSVGFGDQVLLTEAAVAVAGPALTGGVDVLDLGAHRLRDLLQAEHIYQLRGPGLAIEFPPLKSLDRLRHNLPAQPTALLGREAELATVRALLQQDDVRIVTLTGAGGTGKTRLGIQTGAELLESFPDGVWFVPLAVIADPKLVVPAIALPLGVRETPDEPLLKTLQDYLQPRQALLLLDNFEHVTAAAQDVASLLAACPKLKVLVTSREPLRISGERELGVPPLSLPSARQARHFGPSELLEFSAIRLFVERSQSVKPDFALTDANGADVAAICLRLDGLPLAIELAAARIRILPPAQLLARLDNRLKLLTGGARDLPARQQTLRAAIEWSHDLLSDDDQTLFARLSVFAGGCTLEAAEAVCTDVGDILLDVLDGIESLIQKSLLRKQDDNDGMPRFTMLQTIREFGLERLDAAGESNMIRCAHADYMLALAEEAEPRLRGIEQVPWLNRLNAEHDNLRAALGDLDQPADAETRLRLAGSLWRFWWVRGHLTEGRGWLDRALTTVANLPPAVRAKALNGSGILAEAQGDYRQAIAHHKTALGLWQSVGDMAGSAASLTNLGTVATVQGDYADAIRLHEAALAIWTELGDHVGIADSQNELGAVALSQGNYPLADSMLKQSLESFKALGDAPGQGTALESLGILAFYQERYEEAALRYEDSLQVWRRLDDARMIAHSLSNLGEATHRQGNLSRAEELFQDSLTQFRELGERRGEAFVLYQLGKIAKEKGDESHAVELFSQSLTLRQQAGDEPAVIESLEGIAAVACMKGHAADAAQLLAAAEARRIAIGAPRPPAYLEEHVRQLEAARVALGDAGLAAAWESGLRLSLPEAIDQAAKIGQSWASLDPRL